MHICKITCGQILIWIIWSDRYLESCLSLSLSHLLQHGRIRPASSIRHLSIHQHVPWVSCERNSSYSFVPIILKLCTCFLHSLQIEGWAQDYRKSDDCFSPNLISSPWRRYEDYNISFCKQWKFRCHCSYEQWHLNLHCLQRGPGCP